MIKELHERGLYRKEIADRLVYPKTVNPTLKCSTTLGLQDYESSRINSTYGMALLRGFRLHFELPY